MCFMQNSIFIPINTPSSKNGNTWTGKFLVGSKVTQAYKRNTHLLWELNRNKFLEMIKDKPKPYFIGMYFIRDSKRKFDFQNACQLPFDLMQKYGWLENDDSSSVVPVFLGYHVDKSSCGVQITVLKNVTYEY